MKKKELWRMAKFTFFSISAGLIELGSFALLSAVTDWSYWPRYLIALTLSVLWNFTLNRSFTFHSAANVPVAVTVNGQPFDKKYKARVNDGNIEIVFHLGSVIFIR